MKNIKQYFIGIWENRFILENLVRQDLRMKYNRSMLGVAWAVITPVGLAVIIGLIYSIIFSTDPKTFIPSLFAALNPWIFLSTAAESGTTSYICAEGYIKQTNVKAQIFPLRGVLGAYVNLLYSICAFVAIYLILAPEKFGPKMLMVFPGLIIILIAGMALANISSSINLCYRDYQPLQSLALQALFYVTPIIYTSDMLDEKGFSLVYKLNPFYYFIEVIRTPLQGIEMLSWNVYFIAIALAVGLWGISILVTMRTCKGLAFKL